MFPSPGKEGTSYICAFDASFVFLSARPSSETDATDIVIFGQILGSNRAPATPGTLLLTKNIPDLAVSASIIGYGKTLQSSVLTSMVYACGRWEKEPQSYFEFFLSDFILGDAGGGSSPLHPRFVVF